MTDLGEFSRAVSPAAGELDKQLDGFKARRLDHTRREEPASPARPITRPTDSSWHGREKDKIARMIEFTEHEPHP
jgi:hypothetical protein